MRKRTEKRVENQVGGGTESGILGRVGQILLPMVAGIEATKAELTSWVHERGMEALRELLRSTGACQSDHQYRSVYPLSSKIHSLIL